MDMLFVKNTLSEIYSMLFQKIISKFEFNNLWFRITKRVCKVFTKGSFIKKIQLELPEKCKCGNNGYSVAISKRKAINETDIIWP